jgi:methylglutaconyl-CoA hydratase
LDYSTILVADDGPIRNIALNRPDRRNAMTPEMQMELIAALEDTAACGHCRVLVLSGMGAAFCSGLDLSVLPGLESDIPADSDAALEHRADAERADAERVARLFLALYELPMPTIAAVHGAAVAGGSGLAFIPDFTIATPLAKFGFTEVRIGFVPALVSAFLSLQIGDKHARDLLLTGRIFTAEEAHHLGLVTDIVPQEELAHRVKTRAESLAAASPRALASIKQLLAAQHRTWLDHAIALAIESNSQARATPDFREGLAAFIEKRKPIWPK